MRKLYVPFCALMLSCSLLIGCGGSGGGGGSRGPDEALFAGPLMFIGAQMHIYDRRNIQLADFNDDGLPELFYEGVGDPLDSDSALHLLPGSESEIFGAEQFPGVGQSSTIADFDNDGNPDIVTLQSFDSRGFPFGADWSLLRGNGDNTFAEPELLDVTDVAVPSLESVAADINGDGFQDLLSLGYNKVEILPLVNQGDGSFEPAPGVPAISSFGALFGIDLNHDTFDDIVFYDFDAVAVALSNGDGTFGALEIEIEVPNEVPPPPADLNNDGNVDIVGVLNNDDIVAFLGVGDGAFASALPSPLEPALVATAVLAIADFNGDEIPDLVVTGDLPSRGGEPESVLGVALGLGDGTFDPTLGIADAITSNQALTMDADRDGNLDVLVVVLAGLFDQTIFLRPYFGNGDGTFREESSTLIEIDSSGNMITNTPLPGVVTTQPLDVDTDGNLDLMINNGTTAGDVSLLLGNGDGTFASEDRIPLNNVRIRQTSDLDADGDVDFFGTNLQVFLTILRNYGGGDLQSLPLIAVDNATTFTFEGATDVDIDGLPDLVYGFFDGTVRVNYGLGDMQFESLVTVANTGEQALERVVDITGDGYPDLVSRDSENGMDQFFVRPGGPGRTFGSPVLTEIPIYPGDSLVNISDLFPCEFADFNGDGRTDIVRLRDRVSNNQEQTILSLLHGQADGSLVHVQDVFVPWTGFIMKVADLDLDDDPDVFVGSVTFLDILSGEARLFGNAFFTNANGFSEPIPVVTVTVGDLPGDVDADTVDVTGEGIPDIVIYSETTGMAVAVGQGDGTFSRPYYFQTGGGTRPAIGDFDNDGDADFAAIIAAGGQIEVIENRLVQE